MGDSVAQQIYNAAQALLQAVRLPGANIAERLNSTLNQFLTWPFRAGSGCIIDAQGYNATFDTVIYTSSGGNLKEFFHVTYSMASERCLSACADTQAGLPAAIKANATD